MTAAVRSPAEIVRAIRESPAFTPGTVHERQRAAFGIALAARLCVHPALLRRGQSTAARWIGDSGEFVPRSLRDWEVLCAAGDIDAVLFALEAMSEYADELRASHPFIGILDDADVAVIRRSARRQQPTAPPPR